MVAMTTLRVNNIVVYSLHSEMVNACLFYGSDCSQKLRKGRLTIEDKESLCNSYI